MEVSAVAQWVVSRVVDIGVVIAVAAVVGSSAARLVIHCLETVRKTWLTRGQQ